MKQRIWNRILCIALMLLCMLYVAPLAVGAATTGEAAVVSYGLSVFSARTDMAVSAPVGNEVTFSQDVFARALNLSKVNYITIKTLPATTEGELLLGSTRIAAGQSISADNLPYMCFCAASDDITQASFTFTANGSATPMVCRVYWLTEVNYTPTVSLASGLSLNVSTYKGYSAYGTLSAYDPDGDSLVFEVVSYPQNGSVQLTDSTLGSYVYTPARGYTGSDSFSYVARDQYGNYSASATVSLKVSTLGTSVTYVDMQDSKYYNAALTLTEAGVMSGTQVGNQYYFYPEQTVSRVEFLVMAMNAAGITDVPETAVTVFADDADIPESMKGYVHAAYTMGYVSGSLANGELKFLPNEEITRAQAAVILSNIIGVCDVAVTPTFADGSEIPAWASEAIYSLNAIGVLNTLDGYMAPTEYLTRVQSAQILSAVMAYVA